MKALALLELIRMMGVGGDIEKTIDEAIKELEELNNKSCEGCIYNTYAFENEQCTYCSRRCVDFYEAKGE